MATLPKTNQPFVPEHISMKELTWRAVLLGLLMTVVLGAANAYLGLRAGMTIAATYPAAVISMAVLRGMKGSLLEENIARTAGSIGEAVAAGAVFTLPAFLISHSWQSFSPRDAYWKSTVLMMVGSVLGVLFVSLVRRVMVEDPELPFPEIAAAEIHKAGQRGAQAAKFLFWNIGLGGMLFLLGRMGVFAPDKDITVPVGQLGASRLRLGGVGSTQLLQTGGVTSFAGPSVSPAYLGVGYIIGPRLAGMQFSGALFAWGLLVPLLVYLMGPQLRAFLPAGAEADTESWAGLAASVGRYIVRPVAVGGMLVGAVYTLWRMRTSIMNGLVRAIKDLKQTPEQAAQLSRTERYMSSKTIFWLIAVVFAAMIALYIYLSNDLLGGVVAAIVMLILGFFFCTVSGYLVGIIGSSNNPISGLTFCTLIVAALLMVALGVSGASGVAAVLGVAAVVCVSSAVGGELLQDFKVGYMLGGTPRNIQIVELLAVMVASAVMYFPLLLLHQGDINAGGTGLGGRALPAPQAGLMALLAQGIVGGDMAWPLVIFGMLMAISMILLGVKSPMLVMIGMYLPFETTSAIFIGGLTRALADRIARGRGYNESQQARIENAGVLTASGLIAGEALMGLVWAMLQFDYAKGLRKALTLSEHPLYPVGLLVMIGLVAWMVLLPMRSAGRADEPAPPVAMM